MSQISVSLICVDPKSAVFVRIEISRDAQQPTTKNEKIKVDLCLLKVTSERGYIIFPISFALPGSRGGASYFFKASVKL
ncbi:MAG: hypothetical protein PXY39_11550 [archaeon]|nr:hypothetical protein [archaeon]